MLRIKAASNKSKLQIKITTSKHNSNLKCINIVFKSFEVNMCTVMTSEK